MEKLLPNGATQIASKFSLSPCYDATIRSDGRESTLGTSSNGGDLTPPPKHGWKNTPGDDLLERFQEKQGWTHLTDSQASKIKMQAIVGRYKFIFHLLRSSIWYVFAS